jgi:hypothetical protein
MMVFFGWSVSIQQGQWLGSWDFMTTVKGPFVLLLALLADPFSVRGYWTSQSQGRHLPSNLSSSLNLWIDPMALVASPGHSVDRPLLVPDASTAPIMPICNPTDAFVLRAVRLVRTAVGKALFAS